METVQTHHAGHTITRQRPTLERVQALGDLQPNCYFELMFFGTDATTQIDPALSLLAFAFDLTPEHLLVDFYETTDFKVSAAFLETPFQGAFVRCSLFDVKGKAKPYWYRQFSGVQLVSMKGHHGAGEFVQPTLRFFDHVSAKD